MKTEEVTRPAINCNFTSTPNAKEKECLQNFEEWLKKFPSSGDGYQKSVALVSRSIPQASSEYLLFVCKVLFLENRFMQQVHNENGERMDTIEKLITTVDKIILGEWNGVGEFTEIEKTAADIINSAKHLLNPDLEKRFSAKLASFLRSISALESNRRRGQLPSFTEVMSIRQCSSSTEMFIDLCEAGQNLCMLDENRCDSVIQRIVKTVIKLSFIGKDLSSFECSDDYNVNVVSTVKREKKCNWQEAVDETVHMYTSEHASMVALERLVDTDEIQDGKTVKKYLKMLKFIVKAMHEFNELSKELSVKCH